MSFNVTFTKEELPDLRKVLDRAMKTWEPQNQPRWLQGLSERVDRALDQALPVPFSPLLTNSLPYHSDLQTMIIDQIMAQQRAAGLLASGGVR